MATINASVSNFFSITDLAARGIGSGRTISHATVPAFFSDSVKTTGVNYASVYSHSMIGSKSLGSVVTEYDSAKSSFQTEFKQAMGNAKKTGDALKHVDYRGSSTAKQGESSGDKFGNFASASKSLSNTTLSQRNGTPRLLDQTAGNDKTGKFGNADIEEDEKKADGRASDEQVQKDGRYKDDALANESRKTPPFRDEEDTAAEIEGLINQYNDAVGYLQSKVGISSQFDYFAASFHDTEGLVQDMEGIGVNVEPTGMLSVDAQTLTRALQEKPDSVEQALGQDGLAGQIDRKTASSDYQADRMFPSLDVALGQPDDHAKGMYAPNMHIASTMRGNRGNLMDMYL